MSLTLCLCKDRVVSTSTYILCIHDVRFLHFVFDIYRLRGSSLSFSNCHKSPKIFPIYLLRKSLCIIGPMQFKPVLFKDELYLPGNSI